MIRLLFLMSLLVGSPALAQQPQYFPITGGMKVELIPNGKLAETFNDPSTLDTTNNWSTPTTNGTGAATYSQGQEVLSSGTTAGSYALLQSQATFQINSPSFLLWRGAINAQTEIAGNCKQMGFFIAAGSPTCAAPVTDGILFEITSSTTPSGTTAGGLAGAGKLQAVTYAGGTRTLLADLSVTIAGINWAPIFAADGSVVCPGRNTPQAFTDTCPHILDIWFNGNSAEFDVDFKPVAFMLVGSLGPNNNALRWAAMTISGGAAVASTVKINQAVVGDEARNSGHICDPVYGWRCVTVGPTGTLSVSGGTATVGGNTTLAVTSASARIAYPVSTSSNPSVLLLNDGQNEIFVGQGDNTVVANTTGIGLNSIPIPPSSFVCLQIGTATNVAAITLSGTSTLRITQYTACPVAGTGPAGYATGAGATTASTLRETLASDSPGIIANAVPGTPNTITVLSVQGEPGMTPVQGALNVAPSIANGNGTVAAASANAADGITPIVSGSAVSSLVLKASAGNLYNVYAECSAACWLMVFNSVSAPSNGATTAGTASGNLVECVAIAAGANGAISYGQGPPEVFSVGITAAISSTTCATLTLATTGFLHGMIK